MAGMLASLGLSVWKLQPSKGTCSLSQLSAPAFAPWLEETPWGIFAYPPLISCHLSSIFPSYS